MEYASRPSKNWHETLLMFCLISAFLSFAAAAFLFCGGKFLFAFISLAYELIFISLSAFIMYLSNLNEDTIRDIYQQGYQEGYARANLDRVTHNRIFLYHHN